MKKRSLTGAFFILLLSILIVSTLKVDVYAQTTPKISIVSLDHVPFVEGDNNEFYISAKNYTGQVQYQLFYIQESAMKDWKLIDNSDMTNGWTNPIDAQTPSIVDISNLNLKADKYRFAIRVRRVGVKGLNQNKYGDYDDVYPFTLNVDKASDINLNSNMRIDKTEFSQSENLIIDGINDMPLTTQYKLHLFDVKNSKWINNLTDYNMNIDCSISKIPVGTYIADVWVKNSDSNKTYDGWKLKVIKITKTTDIVDNDKDYVEEYVNTGKVFSSNLNYGGLKGDGYFDDQSEEIERKYYAYYNLNSIIYDYNKALSEAMISQNLSVIQSYFVKGSKLYNEQKNIVEASYNKSNERFVNCMVLDYSYNPKKNLYKVNVIEKYELIKEDNITQIKTNNKLYIIDGNYESESIVDIQTKDAKIGNGLEQYGYINKVYQKDDGRKFLEIELVDIFGGDEAVKAAKEDGYLDKSENSIDDDIYIRNKHEVKTFEISDFAYFEDMRTTNLEEIDFSDLSYECDKGNPLAAIIIEKSIVQKVLLPYMP
jgi:hypothetical protein